MRPCAFARLSRAPFLAVAALAVGSVPAGASTVLSSVSITHPDADEDEPVVSQSPGQVVTRDIGANTAQAMTELGVNKVSASSSGFEIEAGSLWGSNFRVEGVGTDPVTVKLGIRIDGLVASGTTFAGDDDGFNYWFKAISGRVEDSDIELSDDGVDGMSIVHKSVDFGVTTRETVDFLGDDAYNRYSYYSDDYYWYEAVEKVSDHFYMQSYTFMYGEIFLSNFRYYQEFFEIERNGVWEWQEYAGYNDYDYLTSVFPILDSASLCGLDDICRAPGAYDQELSLEFTVAPGTDFYLYGAFLIEDLTGGSVDFFNTARLTGIELSSGATLTADGAPLVLQSDGTYNFATAVAPVPEPATWAMMIGGFGLVGGAMRRRRPTPALA